MKKMKRFLGIMLAMVMAVTMLAGCGGSSKESNSSDNGKTLKFGCFSYSESLDPANIINSAWCNSRYGIGECLFKYKDDFYDKYFVLKRAKNDLDKKIGKI